MQTLLNHKFDNNFVFITGLSILREIGNYKYIFYDNCPTSTTYFLF